MHISPRALAGSGVACLAALAVAGCSTTGSSSSSSAVTVSGKTLSVYLSEPTNLGRDTIAQDIVHAEQMAFAAYHKQIRDYNVVLRPVRLGEVSDNARSAIVDSSTIAYLGELGPGQSDSTVGITNALDILQVSPTDNALELSQRTPAVSGGPKSYFESWSNYGRTFARLVPSGAAEAQAQANEMKSLGLKRLYVANDGSDYGKAIADAVTTDAGKAGISAARSLAGADAIFYGGRSPVGAAHFFNHAASAAPGAKLFGPSSLNSDAFSSALSGSVKNLYVSIPGFLPRDLPAAGKKFVRAFKAAYGHAPNVEAIFGYEAMSAVMHVLATAGAKANNRTNVVAAFLTQHKVQSVLGTYSLDGAGNTNLNAFVFARISGGKLVPFAAAPQS